MDSFIIFSLKAAKLTTLLLKWFSKLWQGCTAMALINETPFRGLAGANMCDLKEIKETETGREISNANGSGKRKER